MPITLEKLPSFEHAEQEVKDKFQKEFVEAIQAAKFEVEIKRAEIARQNTDTFLQHPIEVLEQLDNEKPKGYTLGEMLSWCGVGTVTCKRFGKGTLVGKGSDYLYINFRITAIIGSFTLTKELSSDNSQRSKDAIMTLVLEQLAVQIKQKCEEELKKSIG